MLCLYWRERCPIKDHLTRHIRWKKGGGVGNGGDKERYSSTTFKEWTRMESPEIIRAGEECPGGQRDSKKCCLHVSSSTNPVR